VSAQETRVGNMTSTDDNRFFLPAWGISLTLHGVAVSLAFVFATQIKPIVQEEVFKWDVALVEAARSEAMPRQVQSDVPQQQPLARVIPSPRTKPRPEMSQTVTPIEQKLEPPQPTIETVQPIQKTVEVPQVREEPVEQRIVEVAEPTSEPVADSKEPESVAVTASAEPVESQPVQPGPVQTASTPALSAEVPVAAETPASVSSQDSSVTTAQASSPDVKADHRWLAESLWRRVAELKRYPSSARMNGQEGKVILKAVIRSDGQLAEVSVQKSSGHSALDAAAMEAVKLACPLHMKHVIGKPLIVVSLPIVYSLAN
jgi:periplasmic protein TonB